LRRQDNCGWPGANDCGRRRDIFVDSGRIACLVYPVFRLSDDEHGIIPDVPVTDKLRQPYQNDDDPVLAFTLDHVKKARR